MLAISSCRGNRYRPPATDRTDYNTLRQVLKYFLAILNFTVLLPYFWNCLCLVLTRFLPGAAAPDSNDGTDVAFG